MILLVKIVSLLPIVCFILYHYLYLHVTYSFGFSKAIPNHLGGSINGGGESEIVLHCARFLNGYAQCSLALTKRKKKHKSVKKKSAKEIHRVINTSSTNNTQQTYVYPILTK